MKLINELLVIFLLIHGLIHLFGFAKSAKLKEFDQFSDPVSRFEGIMWLTTSVLLLTSGVLLILGFRYWLAFAVLSIVSSQLLILKYWKDAKAGTIVNIVILIALFASTSVK